MAWGYSQGLGYTNFNKEVLKSGCAIENHLNVINDCRMDQLKYDNNKKQQTQRINLIVRRNHEMITMLLKITDNEKKLRGK